MAIRIEDSSGPDFAQDLLPAWEEFRLRASVPAPFVHPEYLTLWLETQGAETRPRVITAWRDGDLVGYAPFMEAEDALGPLPVSSLRFIGNNIGHPGDVLYAEMAASSPREEVIRGMLSHAKSVSQVTRWNLGYLRPDSATVRMAREFLGLSEAELGRLPHQPYVWLELPGDWEAYMRGLSRNTLKGYRRRRRKLEGLGDLTMRVDDEADRASRRVVELIQNHERCWGGTPRAGWFGGANVHRFHAQAARFLAHQGQFLAFTLELDGAPIAWSVGALDDHRYYSQMSSYDREYAAYSPGTLLSLLLLRHLSAMTVRRVELGPGLNERKRSLGGRAIPYVHLYGHFGLLRPMVRLRRSWMRRRSPS